MDFYRPWMFWAALMAAAALYARFRRRPKAVMFPGAARLSGTSSVWKQRIPHILLALSSLMFLTAAAGPRGAANTTTQIIKGVDVVLALDVSASMTAEDFKPDRIEAAKARIKEFIGRFEGGRLALVAFAGRSFTQCPLTTDKGIITDLLDQLDVGSVAIDGTAIGDAVINALNKFKDDGGARSIVLLTDGESNSGTTDPISAARAARTMGVKIYAIGVGTPEGAPIPAYGPMGQRYYLTDQYGNLVLAKVDEKTLKEMADITGGAFFMAKDSDALREVYDKIASLEKKDITVKKNTRYRELFQYPAAAGLILMIAGAFLGSGRFRTLSGPPGGRRG